MLIDENSNPKVNAWRKVEVKKILFEKHSFIEFIKFKKVNFTLSSRFSVSSCLISNQPLDTIENNINAINMLLQPKFETINAPSIGATAGTSVKTIIAIDTI